MRRTYQRVERPLSPEIQVDKIQQPLRRSASFDILKTNQIQTVFNRCNNILHDNSIPDDSFTSAGDISQIFNQKEEVFINDNQKQNQVNLENNSNESTHTQKFISRTKCKRIFKSFTQHSWPNRIRGK